MKKITNNMITGECYGIAQQIIEGLVTGRGTVTMSRNLGGTNNLREYVIVCANPEDTDSIIADYLSAINK